MSCWKRLVSLWPWSAARREHAAKAKQVEERFQAQLKEAEERQFNLQAAVTAMREQREQRETKSRRTPSLNGEPVTQE